jgi:hypothetical protein
LEHFTSRTYPTTLWWWSWWISIWGYDAQKGTQAWSMEIAFLKFYKNCSLFVVLYQSTVFNIGYSWQDYQKLTMGFRIFSVRMHNHIALVRCHAIRTYRIQPGLISRYAALSRDTFKNSHVVVHIWALLFCHHHRDHHHELKIEPCCIYNGGHEAHYMRCMQFRSRVSIYRSAGWYFGILQFQRFHVFMGAKNWWKINYALFPQFI